MSAAHVIGLRPFGNCILLVYSVSKDGLSPSATPEIQTGLQEKKKQLEAEGITRSSGNKIQP